VTVVTAVSWRWRKTAPISRIVCQKGDAPLRDFVRFPCGAEAVKTVLGRPSKGCRVP
jgi:hypothetical protein